MWGFLVFLLIVFLLRKHIKRFFLKMIIFILAGIITIMLIDDILTMLIVALAFFVAIYIFDFIRPKFTKNPTKKSEGGRDGDI